VTDDPALLDAARSGDRKALERLLVLEEPRIYAYGLRMCGDPEDAREVLQETMLAVTRHIGGFRGDAKLSTWLFQLARSACSKQRRRLPPTSDGEVELVDHNADPERTASAQQLAELLQRALSRLTETQREVLILRDVEGLSAPEVSEILHLEVGAVKSRLHRARAALAEALDAEQRVPRLKLTGCPDILVNWSEREEGDIDHAVCEKLEAHVATCPACRARCDQLTATRAACRELPPVPAAAHEAARSARETR
jgi:RNA polymerase sigma-70 factor (ECF subfamily)